MTPKSSSYLQLLCHFTCAALLLLSVTARAQDSRATGAAPQSSARPISTPSAPAPAFTPSVPATPAPNPVSNPTPGATPAGTLGVGSSQEVPIVPDRIVRIGVRSNPSGIPQFDPPQIEVTAGQQVEVILRNNESQNSGITHNWVLIKPGSESAVAALGKEAGVDPDAVTYSPSVLAATRTTRPGNEGIIDFLAPEKPGRYPYLSLVGDQRKVLKGVLIVKPIGIPIEHGNG